MTDFILYPLSFVVVLGVLIVVHEFGHYSVARWCGVKVLRFSVGFGKPIARYQSSPERTEWVLAAFPLGGYVKMLDEREAPVADFELHQAFNRQSLGKRSAIVAAGPVANFILAFFIYWACFWTGSLELLPVVAEPPSGSPAAQAKIYGGDRIHRVDGEPVRTWQEFRWALLSRAAEKSEIVVESRTNDGRAHVHHLNVEVVARNAWEGDPLDQLGFQLFRPSFPAVIGKLVENGPAATAGLLPGDKILAIDGKNIADWHELVTIIRESTGAESLFKVSRADQTFDLRIAPQLSLEGGKSVGKIGVGVLVPAEARVEMRENVRYGFFESGVKAAREVWEKSEFSLVMLGKMLTGSVSWKNLSGPVTIADYAGQSAKMGWDTYLKFMALVSISLGVLNLLPVPVLDGGHLMYYMLEAINRGPLSEKFIDMGQRIGLALLFTLMAFAFFNDITRLFSG